MKKEVIAFLIVILVVPICYGQSIYNSEELDVKLIIDGGFEIKREKAVFIQLGNGKVIMFAQLSILNCIGVGWM